MPAAVSSLPSHYRCKGDWPQSARSLNIAKTIPSRFVNVKKHPLFANCQSLGRYAFYIQTYRSVLERERNHEGKEIPAGGTAKERSRVADAASGGFL